MASAKSSVSVAVRVRPFTQEEASHLVKKQEEGNLLGDGALAFSERDKENEPHLKAKRLPTKGIRKIVNVVDDNMLIFDPLKSSPLAELSKNIHYGTGKELARFREHKYIFDQLFDEGSTQEEVYNKTTRPLLNSVLDGYNGTVFAYGATGCGKTYTISGTPEEPGIIFLTMDELFKRIEELQDAKIITVSLSFLEIYNESIRDLMEPDDSKNLTLREDAQKRIIVSNLSSHFPKSAQEVMDMITIGNQNRTVSPTQANATSSRSHAVLQINVSQKNRTADFLDDHTFATLSIIDLAGSERAAATRNRGQRLHEGANINKSLLALGNCIKALCDARRRNHIPYRDSKLTRLLKFSLGGNCKTVMIVCISPSSQHYDETLNTLKYADRAKEITTKVVKNQLTLNRHVGSYVKMITSLNAEIKELRESEGVRIKKGIDHYKIQRQRIYNGTSECIEKIKQNLNSPKFEEIRVKKSLILCKRNLTVRIINELKYIHSLLENNSAFDGISGDVASMVNQFSNKKMELEQLFDDNNDVDDMISRAMNNQTKMLKEMESWSDDDELYINNLLLLIKESFTSSIIENSLRFFDQAENSGEFHYALRVSNDSLMKIFNQEQLNSVEEFFGELSLQFENLFTSLTDFDTTFEKLAVSKLLSNIARTEIFIPTSPIKMLPTTTPATAHASSQNPTNTTITSYKSSPFNLSPNIARLHKLKNTLGTSKITKQTPVSPTVSKIKNIKKVRWNVPEDNEDMSYDENTRPEEKNEQQDEDKVMMDQSFDLSDIDVENQDNPDTNDEPVEEEFAGLKPFTLGKSNSLLTTPLTDSPISSNSLVRNPLLGKPARRL